MDLLKGEPGRYSGCKNAGRIDEAIPPELLCDHDILTWREFDHSYTGRGGEVVDIDYPRHVRNVRYNDVPEPRTVESLFQRITYKFRSDI